MTTLDRKTFDKELPAPPARAGDPAAVHQGARAAGRRDLRGPRRRRQGRRDQAHRRARRTRAAAAIVALGTPTERERTQWYFQRYVAAPARGRGDGPVRPQLVQPRRRRARHGLLHRAGVPGVPALVPGVRADARALGDHPRQVLVLGQRRGAGAALPGPRRRTRCGAGSSARWTSSRASGGWTTRAPRTRCSATPTSSRRPWYVVEADDKRRARLNCIAHLLSLVPYEDDTPPQPIALPPRREDTGYVRPPVTDQTFVPQRY